MGFYIRKSVKVGPFRLNLSKSGVGMSVGVKGLRVGVGPAGRYVHMGRGGLYYRKTFSSTAPSPQQRIPQGQLDPKERARIEQDWSLGAMSEFRSVDALVLTDSNSQDLINELNIRRNLMRLTPIVATFSVIMFLVLLSYGAPGWLLLVLAVPVGVGLYWLRERDEVRKTTALFYSLEGATEAAYRQLCADFETLIQCRKIWRVDAQARVSDSKYHAGAGRTIRRTSLAPSFAEASGIRSNIAVPALPLSENTLYLFPDRILVLGRAGWGAVDWNALQVESSSTRFIEEETVPSDAKVIGNTWRYVNRDGGPDRRFNNNHQIPVCQYGQLDLATSSGLREMLHTSRVDCVSKLRDSLIALPIAHQQDAKQDASQPTDPDDGDEFKFLRSLSSQTSAPTANNETGQQPVPTQGKANPSMGWLVAGGVLILIVFIARSFSTTPEAPATTQAENSASSPVPAEVSNDKIFEDGFAKMIAGEEADDQVQIDAGLSMIESISAKFKPKAESIGAAQSKDVAGTRLLRAGSFAAAAQKYAEGIALDPTNAEIVDNKGYALYKGSKFVDARDAELDALRLAPTRFTAWATLGSAYAALGQGDIGATAFALSIRFAKNQDKAIATLRKLAIDERNPDVRVAAENAYWHRVGLSVAPQLRPVLKKVRQSNVALVLPTEVTVSSAAGERIPVYVLDNEQYQTTSDDDSYVLQLGTDQNCAVPACHVGSIYAHLGNAARDGEFDIVQFPGGVEGRRYITDDGRSLVVFESHDATYGFTFDASVSKDAAVYVAKSALQNSMTELMVGAGLIQASHRPRPGMPGQVDSVVASGTASNASSSSGLTRQPASPTTETATSRWVVNGNAVYDTATKLTWQRCSVGQTWRDGENNCVGNAAQYSFDGAQVLSTGAWRVPTKDELATLVDPDRQRQGLVPSTYAETFPSMDMSHLWYWSSTANELNPSYAWGVHFASGATVENGMRRGSGSVRLVKR